MTPEYLAGFIDGEGALMISRAIRSPYVFYNARISISQKNPKVLKRIQKYLGYGKITKITRGTHWLRFNQKET